MDLKQLHYFVTVADEGSISGGAKKLFLSQPPLSIQLKSLEEELGCILFERGPRNITLTESGKTLYTYAKTILDLSRVAKEEVSASADPSKGTVRIGIVSSLVCEKALRWLAEFSRQNPGIDFEINEGNTYQLLDQLSAGTIHLALVRTPYTKGTLKSLQVGRDRMIAIGNSEFFRTSGDLSLKELAQMPLIVYRRWEATLRKEFEQQRLSPKIHILADDSRTVVKAVELGLGVGIVPQSALEILTEDRTEIREIGDIRLESGMEIVKTPEGYLPGCAKRFWDYMARGEDGHR